MVFNENERARLNGKTLVGYYWDEVNEKFMCKFVDTKNETIEYVGHTEEQLINILKHYNIIGGQYIC